MQRVCKVLSRYVVVDGLDKAAFIYSYLDSIATLEFILGCEQEFGVELANDLLGGEALTLEGLCHQIELRLKMAR